MKELGVRVVEVMDGAVWHWDVKGGNWVRSEVYYAVACDAGKKGVVAVDCGSNCCCKNRENKRGKLGSSGCGSLRYQAEVQGVLPAGGCWVRFGFRRRHVLLLCCSREEEFTREQLLLQ